MVDLVKVKKNWDVGFLVVTPPPFLDLIHKKKNYLP